jgi:glycogen synthase
VIPESLEEAMSKRAQAERERQARIILSTTETEIADNFAAAADRYRDDPAALHLRAMNMIYEGIRQKGSMIIVPSSAVETMGLGALSGIAALAKEKETEAEAPEKKREE